MEKSHYTTSERTNYFSNTIACIYRKMSYLVYHGFGKSPSNAFPEPESRHGAGEDAQSKKQLTRR